MSSTSTPDVNNWIKKGLLLEPTPNLKWLYSHAGPSFVDTTENPAKLYVTGRDEQNRSHIGCFHLDCEGDRLCVVPESGKLVFSPGQLGTFDESGVSYPWLVHSDDKIFMYYVGWTAGGRTRFQNYTGLAVSTDMGTTFQRISPVPILERTPSEPYGSGSCAVWVDNANWKMIYTSFDPWTETNRGARPSYKLREAISSDGLTWTRTQRIVVDFNKPDEYIIGKPMVLREQGKTKLWYSHRGDSYKIGYAESLDGINFARKDSEVGIGTSSQGWDSEMIEYAYVFDLGGRRFMTYNGNGFGMSGLGFAVLDQK